MPKCTFKRRLWQNARLHFCFKKHITEIYKKTTNNKQTNKQTNTQTNKQTNKQRLTTTGNGHKTQKQKKK